MTPVTYSDYAVYAFSQAVMEWLGKIGIEPKGVRSLSIHFDPHDVVTIDVQRIMSKGGEPVREIRYRLRATPKRAAIGGGFLASRE